MALRHYNNGASKILDEGKVESNYLGAVLSPSTPPPPLLTSAEQKCRLYRQRESLPLLAQTTESKRRQQRWQSAAKHRTVFLE